MNRSRKMLYDANWPTMWIHASYDYNFLSVSLSQFFFSFCMTSNVFGCGWNMYFFSFISFSRDAFSMLSVSSSEPIHLHCRFSHISSTELYWNFSLLIYFIVCWDVGGERERERELEKLLIGYICRTLSRIKHESNDNSIRWACNESVCVCIPKANNIYRTPTSFHIGNSANVQYSVSRS